MNAERRASLLSVAVFAGVLATGGLLVGLLDRLDRSDRRHAAAELAGVAGSTLEQQLASSLVAAQALAAVIRETGGALDFDRVAGDLYHLYPGVDSLQAAPGGVIRHIYPLAGNEPAIGLDLAASPLHAADVAAARASRQLVLAGPFPMRQGGVGLAGRIAVYLGPRGEERYWGIATALVRLPRLVQASRLAAISAAGYDYRLSRPGRGGEELIAESTPRPLEDPESVPVRVATGDWVLRVAPRGGWVRPGTVALGLALAAAAAAAFAVLARRVLRQPILLRREVEARTAELERALSAHRAAEEALRQGAKMEAVGRLAGGIAHDFNNLLQAILGYVDVSLEGPGLPPGLREDLGQVRAAAERAAALTRQLLAFGRRQVLAPALLDVDDVVATLMKLLSRVLGEQVTLRVVPAPRAATVWADRGQLEQVLMNLCVNARDAMPGGGTLTIETRAVALDAGAAAARPGQPTGRFVQLSVTDTGHGIAPEALPHVFEPFFTTKAPGKGTGLGLATAHGIVHQHGGFLSVESEPGRGTTFRVLLPAVEASSAPALLRGRPAQRGGTESLLLAEDDPAVRALAERHLREAGYVVHVAADGPAAVALGSDPALRLDLAVLDVVMPGLGGLAVRDRLRERRPGLAILFCSGYGEEVVGEAVSGAEPLRLLAKPYGRDDLLRAVREALDG